MGDGGVHRLAGSRRRHQRLFVRGAQRGCARPRGSPFTCTPLRPPHPPTPPTHPPTRPPNHPTRCAQGTDAPALDWAMNRALDAWYNDRAWFHALQRRVMLQARASAGGAGGVGGGPGGLAGGWGRGVGGVGGWWWWWCSAHARVCPRACITHTYTHTHAPPTRRTGPGTSQQSITSSSTMRRSSEERGDETPPPPQDGRPGGSARPGGAHPHHRARELWRGACSPLLLSPPPPSRALLAHLERHPHTRICYCSGPPPPPPPPPACA